MARRHSALLLALAAALCALCATTTAQDSTGQVVEGFTIVSNVTGYMFMSRDACDIAALAMATPVNFTQINNIYRFGANSFRPDGRTRRTLIAWTMGNHATGHPYYANGTALFNNSNWIGAFMDLAVTPGGSLTDNQKAVMAITTARLQLPLSYMLTELYAIAEEINPNGTNITATGAPHALDEGFGVYVGNVSDCAPWAYADEGAALFGTLASCDISMVNQAIMAEFNTAQAATLSGNVAQFETARDNIIRHLHVSLIQNVLARARWVQDAWRAANMAETAAQDAGNAFLDMPDEEHMAAAMAATAALANATDALETAKADAYSLYRALGPFVHAQNPMVAHALANYFDLSAPVSNTYATAVRYHLQALYPVWGITPEMVGTYGATSPACPSRK